MLSNPLLLLLLAVFNLQLPLLSGQLRTTKSVGPEKSIAHVPGDIMLGGLFPMHEHNISRREQPCGAIKEEKGIQVGHKLISSRTGLFSYNGDGCWRVVIREPAFSTELLQGDSVKYEERESEVRRIGSST